MKRLTISSAWAIEIPVIFSSLVWYSSFISYYPVYITAKTQSAVMMKIKHKTMPVNASLLIDHLDGFDG